MGAGYCAKCNSQEVAYGVLEVVDETIYYPYTCPVCGHQGKEWYNVVYIESE